MEVVRAGIKKCERTGDHVDIEQTVVYTDLDSLDLIYKTYDRLIKIKVKCGSKSCLPSCKIGQALDALSAAETYAYGEDEPQDSRF